MINKNDRLNVAFVILLVYFTIFNNYNAQIISKQFQRLLKGNRIAEHIITFITILLIAIQLDNEVNISKDIMLSIIIYFIFIATTKLEIQWNLLMIVLIFVYYIYSKYNLRKEHKMNEDLYLTDFEKNVIKENNEKYNNLIVGGIIAFLIMGMIVYTYKKKCEYNIGFTNIKFLFK